MKNLKNKQYKGQGAIILAGLVLFITLISGVYGADFDNSLTYSKNDLKVQIDNVFGLGHEIATAELTSHKSVNEPLNVVAGKNRHVMIYNIETYDELYKNAIGTLEIRNINGVIETKSYHLEYAVYGYVDKPIWETYNSTDDNGKPVLKSRIKEYEKVYEIVEWKDLNSKDLTKGNLTIAVTTDVNWGDYYDGILTLFGKEIDKHAVWNSDIQVQHYYAFDENAGFNVRDEVFYDQRNLTLATNSHWVAGKINTSYDADGDDNSHFDFNYMNFTNKEISLCLWGRYTEDSTGYLMGSDITGTNRFVIEKLTSNRIRGDFGGLELSIVHIRTGNWLPYCYLLNTTTIDVWINGTLFQRGDITFNFTDPTDAWNFQVFDTTNNGAIPFTLLNGFQTDEVMWGNKTLTPSQVADWGTAMQYKGTEPAPPDALPTIELVAPANNTLTNNRIVTFNCSARDNSRIENLSLYIDNVLNYTEVGTGINYSSLQQTLRMAENNYTWNCLAVDNATIKQEAFYNTNWTLNVSYILPNVVLNSPENFLNTTTPSIVFNCSSSDDIGVFNVSLEVQNVTRWAVLNTTANENVSLSKNISFTDGEYQWFCNVTDVYDKRNISKESRYFTIDTTPPTIDLMFNFTNLTGFSLPINSSVNFSVTDAHLGNCFYNTSDVPAYTILPACNLNQFNITWQTAGKKYIQLCVNDTFGFSDCEFTDINITYVAYNYAHSPDAVGEGGKIKFNLWVNSTNIHSTTAFIEYNHTRVDVIGTKFTDYYFFNHNLTTTDGWGNATGIEHNYNWTFSIPDYNVINKSTQNDNFSVYGVSFDNCEALDFVALNLSLKDEELNAYVNATNGSNVEIDLKLSNGGSFWDYHKKWVNNATLSEELDALVCMPDATINASNYTIEYTVGFDSSGHVWEFYYEENGTLNKYDKMLDSLTNRTTSLMDLLSQDSTTFLFEYKDENGLEVDDIIVHTLRKYIGEGLFREVERSAQDTNGETHVHLVEEDVIYYFIITQYGEIIYTSGTYNAKCLSTPCSIELSAKATDVNWSIIDNEGGGYSATADKTTRIVTISFNAGEVSLVNATLFRYQNGSIDVINRTSTTALSGTIQMTAPVYYGNSTYFVSIWKNNEFIKSTWVDLSTSAIYYFGTMGLILSGLIVMTIILMAVSEGVGLIIFTCLALFITGLLKLIDLGWVAMISIICAGGIIIFKLVNRRAQA